MRRTVLILLAAACALLYARDASAGGVWTGVRTQNFLLVGDAGEGEIRHVAERLEQFREVFPRVLPRMEFDSRVPVTVVVFKDDAAYAPFRPLFGGKPSDVSGYFQPGRGVNYITLSVGGGAGRALRTIYHEYVHLMVDNNVGGAAPPWFNEGLAEYYSTFDADGQRVYVGGPVEDHVRLLGRRRMMPLRALFEVDNDSLHRDPNGSRSLFYAQSWALVHYLVNGDGGRRLPQMGRFLDMLLAGAPTEEAFREAFQTDFNTLEGELDQYVRHNSFRARASALRRGPASDGGARSARLTGAEVEAHLGDLLLNTNRIEEAERRLRQSIALDPEGGMAHASLGMALMRRERFAEAVGHLRRGVSLSPDNHLAHYYLAYALSREGADGAGLVGGYTEEATREMREALRRAAELKPDFPESYSLLAWVEVVSGERLDEAVALVGRARRLSPGKDEHVLLLAQIYMRQERFDDARRAIEPLARAARDAHVRERARLLLDTASRMQARAEERAREEREEAEAAGKTEEELLADILRAALRKPLAGETRVRGTLAQVECVAGGVVFHVRAGGREMRIHNGDDFRGVRLVTYTAETGRKLGCGPRQPENHVIVTFRERPDPRAQTDGDLVAVEFVPAAFELNP